MIGTRFFSTCGHLLRPNLYEEVYVKEASYSETQLMGKGIDGRVSLSQPSNKSQAAAFFFVFVPVACGVEYPRVVLVIY